MEQRALDFLLQLALGVIVAALSSWLSVRWSMKKFSHERLWDERKIAYTKIIEALADMKNHASNYLDVIEGSPLAEAKDAFLTGESNRAERELTKISSMGAFIISKDSAQALRTLERETNEALSEPDADKMVGGHHRAVSKCLDQITANAKRELGFDDK